jgi:hypothetical protein
MRPFVISAVLAFAVATPSATQARSTLVVHELDTPVECQTYVNWWGLWITTECQNHFATMRASIESALIETQLFDVVDRWSDAASASQYDVYGTVTGLGTEYKRTSDAGYCVSSTDVHASIDIRIINRATGVVKFGGNVQKSVDQASHTKTGPNGKCSAERSRPFYEIVQRELSLAVARQVAFRIEPITVDSVDGRKVIINRGKPLVSLGAFLKIADGNGFPQRYRVVATMGDRAIAEPMGRPGLISPGAAVEFVESDEADANARRYDKTELP